MSHPSRRLDDAVHQRTRLGILAVLCEGGRADVTYFPGLDDVPARQRAPRPLTEPS